MSGIAAPKSSAASSMLPSLQTTSVAWWRMLPLLMAAAFTLILMLAAARFPWAATYPQEWIVPFDRWLGGAVDWLLKRASLGSILVKDVTRAFGAALNYPTLLLKGVLATGFDLRLGVGNFHIPPLSWV